ncbi:MAG: sodium:calcium antiporter [Gammaproteobacteria bacterium]|nr:MAG: sodium:calcium antiporter [Gammaproteobacteria bacterium]
MLWYSTVIAVGLVALVWSADRFVDGASAIAKRAGLTPMLIGLTIVSVGTSAPEILISIMSALADSGELAVGNALGSNIANVGLVLGVTLLLSNITLERDTTWIDLPLLIVVVLVTWFLLYDLELSRSNSLVLLGMLALFFFRVAQHAKQSDDDIEAREIPTLTLPLAWLSFLGGLALLIASSRILVWAASHIAAELGVSELVIGLTIVAVGTSLPELAASVMSALKGHADMAVGAIVGSNMFNILLVLAIPVCGAASRCKRPWSAGTWSRYFSRLWSLPSQRCGVGMGRPGPARWGEEQGCCYCPSTSLITAGSFSFPD